MNRLNLPLLIRAWTLSKPSKRPVLLVIVVLGSAIGCAEHVDHWLIYKKVSGTSPHLYQGYVTFSQDEPDADKVKKVESQELIGGRPVIDEKHNSHILVYLEPPPPAAPGAPAAPPQPEPLCTKEDKSFRETDAKVVPPTQGKGTTMAALGLGPQAPPLIKSFVCNLNVKHKGGVQVNYKVTQPPSVAGGKDTILVDESVNVHDLYRFRVMAGPVYTSLTKRARSYKTITTNQNKTIISSSPENDAPVNFPLFLKIYWTPRGRDILVDPQWYERFNPIIGINLVEGPLKNLYAGLSVELARGIDIVGGVHWSKIKILDGGFQEGQEFSGVNVPTRESFETGGFVGATVDIGVIGSWLKGTVTGFNR